MPDEHLPALESEQRACGALIEAGEPLTACDRLWVALRTWPRDVRLRQLLALALARTGASRSANALLRQLMSEGLADEETLGLLARTHKDLALDATDADERAWHLSEALRIYEHAYETTGGYWTGINAAAMALLTGDRGRAHRLASAVTTECVRALDQAPDDAKYWIEATLGEAALILGDRARAIDRYARAAALAGSRYGLLASTRRNARLLLQEIDGTVDRRVEAALRIPTVAVFAGHLVDVPGRAHARFPSECAAAVSRAIEAVLTARDVGVGFASAACGADLLFLEALQARGLETQVVLPYEREAFRRDSVDLGAPGDWPSRHDRALECATQVIVASPQRLGQGALSFEYGFRLMDGLAGLRADELGTDLVAVAAWDGRDGDGPGGTAAAVRHWRDVGRPLEIIDMAAILSDTRRSLPEEPPAVSTARRTDSDQPPLGDPAFEPQIVSVVFADARGFSSLSEDQLPRFVREFLGAVASELAHCAAPPLLRNTWGDGLYCVFERPADAGAFAIALSDTIRRTDWTAVDLPADLELRIGLHAGPAYFCLDPVTGRPNYLGTHVSRAARIEPITPPGESYASQAFAALARADRVPFRCDYVGRTSLAKNYGAHPMYVLRSTRTAGPGERS